MRYLLILLAILSLGVPTWGQALPQHTTFVGPCSHAAEEALKILSEQHFSPAFDLFVVCNSADWSALMAKNDLRSSETALTDWGNARMWLGPKAFSTSLRLREVIVHELEHLRCHCDLGERNPHHG